MNKFLILSFMLFSPFVGHASEEMDHTRFNGKYELTGIRGEQAFYDFNDQTDAIDKKDIPLYSTYSSARWICPNPLYVTNGKNDKKTLFFADKLTGTPEHMESINDINEDTDTCEQYDHHALGCVFDKTIGDFWSWTYTSKTDRVVNERSGNRHRYNYFFFAQKDGVYTLKNNFAQSQFNPRTNSTFVSWKQKFVCTYKKLD
jgi:hypothetical protein